MFVPLKVRHFVSSGGRNHLRRYRLNGRSGYCDTSRLDNFHGYHEALQSLGVVDEALVLGDEVARLDNPPFPSSDLLVRR